MDLLHWMCMMPWASADDLVRVLGVSRTTVNRRLAALHDAGWAVSRMVGRRLPATRRWIPTSAGLRQVFEFGHIHRGPYVDDHDHDPLYPGTDDHDHLPWWLGESGIKQLYRQLEPLEAIYQLAPVLFLGDGRTWMFRGVEARLEELRFLRRGQLVSLIATYEGEIQIAYCWIGRELKPARMKEKWRDRFSHSDLQYRLQAEDREWNVDRHFEPRDPDFDRTPQLAGYVMIGPDEWAVRQAMDHLSRGGYGGGPVLLVGCRTPAVPAGTARPGVAHGGPRGGPVRERPDGRT